MAINGIIARNIYMGAKAVYVATGDIVYMWDFLNSQIDAGKIDEQHADKLFEKIMTSLSNVKVDDIKKVRAAVNSLGLGK